MMPSDRYYHNSCAGGFMWVLLALVFALTLAVGLFLSSFAHAGGWATVHRYVKPTGRCPGREVMASMYGHEGGKRTSTGERNNPAGMTAAARDWRLGTVLIVTNPHNGRSIRVRINDRGPYGIAYAKGARLDLTNGAGARLGMRQTSYVCVN